MFPDFRRDETNKVSLWLSCEIRRESWTEIRDVKQKLRNLGLAIEVCLHPAAFWRCPTQRANFASTARLPTTFAKSTKTQAATTLFWYRIVEYSRGQRIFGFVWVHTQVCDHELLPSCSQGFLALGTT
jgi:hypothetical protein